MTGGLKSKSSTTLDRDRIAQSRHSALNTEPRPIRRETQTTKTFPSNANSSSPAAQRTPARSFVQPSSNLPDPANYSSHGVREHTAELASWALTDTSSLTPDFTNQASPGRQDSSSGSTQDSTPLTPNVTATNAPSESHRPEVIHEDSEPASPEAMVHPRPPAERESAITTMLQIRPSFVGRSSSHASTLRSHALGDEDAPGLTITELGEPNERTPLLTNGHEATVKSAKDNRSSSDLEHQGTVSQRPKQNQFRQMLSTLGRRTRRTIHTVSHPKSWNSAAIWRTAVKRPVACLPCVFLGLLLNVLDALSYGMILFPLGDPLFAKTGADGISMFYVSCIASQLVYSLGGSVMKGAVGSQMIEVVPFFHSMTYTIMSITGNENPRVVLATTITSYALSSILTGIVFSVLGAFKLGSLVNFFPRHILIGCIGGVGFFLFVTGIEVSARLDGTLEYDLETARHLVRRDTVLLWVIPLVLSLALLLLKRFIRSPYLVPVFFISVAAIFYVVVTAASSLHIPDLRRQGWIFTKVEADVPFYNFYNYYDFRVVNWEALSATIPAMLALTFFGILHVPINVPALAIAVGEDNLNLNRELVAHGVSNALSGFAGSIQNYLVYVNSVLFVQNGGNDRLAGLMLAMATFGVLVAGPGMIGFVPIMVVGALIFYLGIDLLQEALYDTWGKMNRLEYLTVLIIVLTMGIYDFVFGILVGIVLACLNFVVQTSRKSAIRASYSGEHVESTVRRHPIQRRFLHEVGYQIFVTKLAGMLFFGSVVQVEKKSRALIEEEAFRAQPIKYLIFDFHHVTGIDYSAAEAFTRMERILASRNVKMIISGVDKDDDAGKSLRNVGLWKDDSAVEFFETLNNALESCENELLTAFYRQHDAMTKAEGTQQVPLAMPQRKHVPQLSTIFPISISSPRQRFLHEAATTTLDAPQAMPPKKWSTFKQPLPLMLQVFQELSDRNEDFWFHAVPFFERKEYQAGSVVFERGQTATAFYLLQTGILRATYALPVGAYQESIVAGTTCGELPFFSSTARTATVAAEQDCVLWALEEDAWDRMQREWEEGARELLVMALRLTKERVDAVTSYVLVSAG